MIGLESKVMTIKKYYITNEKINKINMSNFHYSFIISKCFAQCRCACLLLFCTEDNLSLVD
jgi:hypothetical protein